MADVTKETEQHGASITVDVQTGVRSDDQQAPSFEIISHEDGKSYISSDKVDEYKAYKATEAANIKTQIDEALVKIDELDTLKAVEERRVRASELMAKIGEDSDIDTLFNFDDAEDFERTMEYLTRELSATYRDPSAGFGARLEPRSDRSKELYELGRRNARKASERRP